MRCLCFSLRTFFYTIVWTQYTFQQLHILGWGCHIIYIYIQTMYTIMCMCIYIYISCIVNCLYHIYIYRYNMIQHINIYIYRERERACEYVLYVFIYVCLCVFRPIEIWHRNGEACRPHFFRFFSVQTMPETQWLRRVIN